MNPPAFLAIYDPRRSDAATAWRQRARHRTVLVPIVDTAALAIFVSPGTAWLPLAPTGAVIGKLFGSGSATRVEQLPGAALAAHSTFAERYWGDYVVIASDAGGARLATFRAPSGGAHVFRTRVGEVLFLASHLELLRDLEIVAPAIDWDFVAHHLAFSHLHARATGIAGISEIVPGEMVIDSGAENERHIL
ncbi:MAG: hypothetical protein WC580_07955, partial [Agrococcus sp.]